MRYTSMTIEPLMLFQRFENQKTNPRLLYGKKRVECKFLIIFYRWRFGFLIYFFNCEIGCFLLQIFYKNVQTGNFSLLLLTFVNRPNHSFRNWNSLSCCIQNCYRIALGPFQFCLKSVPSHGRNEKKRSHHQSLQKLLRLHPNCHQGRTWNLCFVERKLRQNSFVIFGSQLFFDCRKLREKINHSNLQIHDPRWNSIS